jgi:membrane-bound ClpP family serine protease
MNVKRTFGTILTILGIIGLIYTGISIIQKGGDFTALTVIGIISIIFFFTGISLVRNTKDEAA